MKLLINNVFYVTKINVNTIVINKANDLCTNLLHLFFICAHYEQKIINTKSIIFFLYIFLFCNFS